MAKAIRCAMTDEEFHRVDILLAEAMAMLSLLHDHVHITTDALGETVTAVKVINERVVGAKGLLAKYWDKTREASHG